ncbi:MAG: hypothetical protein A3J52_04005 [Omnitrophica bacterium RIFCSPHIGHO2_02_FULL_49_9]|nr:MAG: hypothetical protein A3J52_04005 [Omnitrophica bacterium RIFCSPHIGHO2_02_FULL_49_9]OGW88947.1 MAG: hypothetical protein A3A73_01470 [Omnitrophica bacterium RIFCSPLOWO2_01_FULL_50_24]
MKQFVIIGLGNFGETLARALGTSDCSVTVIDRDREKIQDLKDLVTQAVVAEAVDKQTLEELGVHRADAVVVAIGDHLEASVLVVLYLKELGAKRILAKANSQDHGKLLRSVGANEIIVPEQDQALRLASNLITPNVLDLIELSGDYSIIEFEAPKVFYSKTLKELALRSKYDVQIIAVNNPLSEKPHPLPYGDYVVRPDDVFFIMGENKKLKHFQKQHGKDVA